MSTRLDAVGITETVRAVILGHSGGKNVKQLYTHAALDTMRTAVTQLELTILSELLSRIFFTAPELLPGVRCE